MTRRFFVLGAALMLLGGVLVRADQSIRIVPIVKDDSVVVSLQLQDAFGDDVKEAIASGLRTTFTYTIDLRMHATLWVDRTMSSAVVTSSDEFDNLTRQHRLTRAVDGKVVDALTTDDAAAAQRWLTTLDRVPVCPTSKLDPSRDYYVRISAQVRPQRGSIVGWANSITGSVRFTFIP